MQEENKKDLVQKFFSENQSSSSPQSKSTSSEYAQQGDLVNTELVGVSQGQISDNTTQNEQEKPDKYPNLIRFKKGQVTVQAKGGAVHRKNMQRKLNNKQLVLSMIACQPKITPSMLESLKKLGIQGNGDNQNAYTIESIMAAALLQKAMKGDIKAYELVLSIIGQKPADNLVVQTDSSVSAALEQSLFGPDEE